jgi:predicted transcriptional regulator
MTLTIRTGEAGLSMFFRDYQQIALRCLWKADDGKSSRDVWEYVNKKLEVGSISRASIINFLNSMVDNDMLNYETTTGKGGHRRIYHNKYSQSEFKQKLTEITINALIISFPEETKKTISSLKTN